MSLKRTGLPERACAGAAHALDFITAFEIAREDRLSYDEMIDRCSEELAALEAWHAQVERSLRE